MARIIFDQYTDKNIPFQQIHIVFQLYLLYNTYSFIFYEKNKFLHYH